MGRNLDLIRLILLEIERQPTFDVPFDIEIPGYQPYEIQFHLRLLEDDDYIITQDISTASETKIRVFRVTNQGADLIDSIRDDTIWKNVKDKLVETGGATALDAVKKVAIKVSLGLF